MNRCEFVAKRFLNEPALASSKRSETSVLRETLKVLRENFTQLQWIFPPFWGKGNKKNESGSDWVNKK